MYEHSEDVYTTLKNLQLFFLKSSYIHENVFCLKYIVDNPQNFVSSKLIHPTVIYNIHMCIHIM